MGFSLNPFTGFGLLEPDMGEAQAQAEFKPYNINASYGSLGYDPSSRTFTSQLSPELMGIQSGLFSQYGQINPEQQLSLFREQAAPFNQAASQNLENRLFSQGRLDASQEYAPGGAMRGLFDSFANQDLQFQQMAAQQAQAQQMNYLNQILGLGNFEQNLFNAGLGAGQIGMQGQLQQSQLQAQQDAFLPNALWGLGGAALGGWASGGFG